MLNINMTKVNLVLSSALLVTCLFNKEWSTAAAWWASFCGWACLAFEESKNN